MLDSKKEQTLHDSVALTLMSASRVLSQMSLGDHSEHDQRSGCRNTEPQYFHSDIQEQDLSKQQFVSRASTANSLATLRSLLVSSLWMRAYCLLKHCSNSSW